MTEYILRTYIIKNVWVNPSFFLRLICCSKYFLLNELVYLLFYKLELLLMNFASLIAMQFVGFSRFTKKNQVIRNRFRGNIILPKNRLPIRCLKMRFLEHRESVFDMNLPYM